MAKVKFEYTVAARLQMECDTEKGKSRLMACDTQIFAHESIEKDWLNDEGLPNKEGMRAQTMGFVQGIVSNIHASHQLGYIDSAEHLRYVISEIERGFAKANIEVRKGKW